MAAERSKSGAKAKRGELALISEIRRRVERTGRTGRAGPADLRLGIGDDCALLAPRRGEEFAVTTDLSIAGRHFYLDEHPARVVGHRTLARGLSDLAAMGARPVAAFLSLGLPPGLTVGRGRKKAWVEGFLDGLLGLAERFDAPLAGGDLAQSPVAVADIVLVGAVEQGRALLRSGAKPGDGIYVTGRLGGAAAGLAALQGLAGRGKRVWTIPGNLADVLMPHLYPEPRIAQGLWLQKKRVATAAIDSSDGISTDLRHVCEESGVAAVVDAAAVPLAPGATLEQALDGGEDYELLFTARDGARVPRAIGGVAVTRIGRMVRQRKGTPLVTLMGEKGPMEMVARGWQHFA